MFRRDLMFQSTPSTVAGRNLLVFGGYNAGWHSVSIHAQHGGWAKRHFHLLCQLICNVSIHAQHGGWAKHLWGGGLVDGTVFQSTPSTVAGRNASY